MTIPMDQAEAPLFPDVHVEPGDDNLITSLRILRAIRKALDESGIRVPRSKDVVGYIADAAHWM